LSGQESQFNGGGGARPGSLVEAVHVVEPAGEERPSQKKKNCNQKTTIGAMYRLSYAIRWK
jgi:hypothetical protein